MDVTEITATKGNKWNVTENAKFCLLDPAFTIFRNKHDHKIIQGWLGARLGLLYFSP